eukprot:scaffold126619_cov40-Attheya_sp.AAC.1
MSSVLRSMTPSLNCLPNSVSDLNSNSEYSGSMVNGVQSVAACAKCLRFLSCSACSNSCLLNIFLHLAAVFGSSSGSTGTSKYVTAWDDGLRYVRSVRYMRICASERMILLEFFPMLFPIVTAFPEFDTCLSELPFDSEVWVSYCLTLWLSVMFFMNARTLGLIVRLLSRKDSRIFQYFQIRSALCSLGDHGICEW